MRIERVSVKGLFGRFNHQLPFSVDEPITIMISPNGFGKTMILRILNALFGHSLGTLARLPFHEVVAVLDDQSEIRVVRKRSEDSDRKPRWGIELHRAANGKTELFVPEAFDVKDMPFSLGAIDELLPVTRIASREWRDHMTGEVFGLEELLARYGDDLPALERKPRPHVPDWLQQLRQAIPVRLIGTERLVHAMPSPRSARHARLEESRRAPRAVRQISEELAERVRQTLTEYGTLAQSLDRSFPARLVEEPAGSDFALDALRRELAAVEDRRSQLVEAGLLQAEQEDWQVPVLDRVDEQRRGVLAVYARDARRKLSVFDDLFARVDTLKRIVNARFLYKQIKVDVQGLGVVGSDGSQLEPELLSSGEQHQLVLMYELLFRVPHNSLILVDEPELSLHVAWQDEILRDLADIANLGSFRVLLATHSPQIIAGRWDLAVDLKGPTGV